MGVRGDGSEDGMCVRRHVRPQQRDGGWWWPRGRIQRQRCPYAAWRPPGRACPFERQHATPPQRRRQRGLQLLERSLGQVRQGGLVRSLHGPLRLHRRLLVRMLPQPLARLWRPMAPTRMVRQPTKLACMLPQPLARLWWRPMTPTWMVRKLAEPAQRGIVLAFLGMAEN